MFDCHPDVEMRLVVSPVKLNVGHTFLSLSKMWVRGEMQKFMNKKHLYIFSKQLFVFLSISELRKQYKNEGKMAMNP